MPVWEYPRQPSPATPDPPISTERFRQVRSGNRPQPKAWLDADTLYALTVEDTAPAAAGVLLFLVFFGLWVAAFVYWIVALVEVVRIPEQQFRAAGAEKTVWILIVVLAQIVGALIWRFAKRGEVLAAAGRIPAPPPGWYPEPGTGALRWWDGTRWTDVRHEPPPPPG